MLASAANQLKEAQGTKRKRLPRDVPKKEKYPKTLQKTEKLQSHLLPNSYEQVSKRNKFIEKEDILTDWADENINFDLQLEVDPNLEDQNGIDQNGEIEFLSSDHFQQLKDLKEIHDNTHSFEKLKEEILQMREEIASKDTLIATLTSEKESLLQEKQKLLGFIQDIQRDCTTVNPNRWCEHDRID